VLHTGGIPSSLLSGSLFQAILYFPARRHQKQGVLSGSVTETSKSFVSGPDWGLVGLSCSCRFHVHLRCRFLAGQVGPGRIFYYGSSVARISFPGSSVACCFSVTVLKRVSATMAACTCYHRMPLGNCSLGTCGHAAAAVVSRRRGFEAALPVSYCTLAPIFLLNYWTT
jgi:hypothetical protein